MIKWLIANGYKFISIKELEYYITHKIEKDKSVFISFDDGWKGNLDLNCLVEKYKVPITIFVTTDAVIEGNFWWEYARLKGQHKYSGIKKVNDFKKLPELKFKEKIEVLKKKYVLNRSCITLEELLKLNSHEMITIGSHTKTHPILNMCSQETQTEELIGSKISLSNWLKKDIEYISFPNGNYNEDTIEITKKSGYKLAFSVNPGRIDVKKVDPYIVPRNALYDHGGYYENISKILGIWQYFFV